MKKTASQIVSIILLAVILLLIGLAAKAQTTAKPKQHVFYDTVKNVVKRIDYSPDTIPVYFKEIIVGSDTAFERIQKGFIIWQTYYKVPFGTVSSETTICCGNGVFSMNNTAGYYIDEYTPGGVINETFLYSDRKTVVKNKVIFSMKR